MTASIDSKVSGNNDAPGARRQIQWPHWRLFRWFQTKGLTTELFEPDTFAKNSARLWCVYCLSASLSIFVSQTIVILQVLYWALVCHHRAKESAAVSSPNSFDRAQRSYQDIRGQILVAIFSWWFAACITALWGMHPLRSFFDAAKMGIVLLIPLALEASFRLVRLSPVDTLRQIENYFLYFLLGQCIAAIHTILADGLGIPLPLFSPGPVTESGQLVLILPIVTASAFIMFSIPSLRNSLSLEIFRWSITPTSYAICLFVALLVVSWPGALFATENSELVVLVRLLALTITMLLFLPPVLRGLPEIRSKRNSREGPVNVELFQLTWPAAALLFSALIINLKRGPWFGVFTELAIIGILLSRRFFLSTVIIATLVIVSFAPARTRLLNFQEHFSIAGGRQMMWELGAELAQKFPLGIGMSNARYMRELDPSIPETHRHMHNNLLNVTVETGWIGLIAYLWLMYTVIKSGFTLWNQTRETRDRFQRQLGFVALFLSVALLGWQVAGLVEYNFGDGEIRMMAFFFIGLLLAIASSIASIRNSAKPGLDLAERK